MKRIKIMLTAVAVLAVVGGALAFKAIKFNNICYYSSTTSHTSTIDDPCPFQTTSIRVTAPGGTIYNTTAQRVAGVCPVRSCTVRHLTAAGDTN